MTQMSPRSRYFRFLLECAETAGVHPADWPQELILLDRGVEPHTLININA